MSKLKDETINQIIAIEGGYVNDPKDSGGETNFGITVSVARANGYSGSMKAMDKKTAFDIYARKYWDVLNLSKVELLNEAVAKEIADTGVNMGVRTAAKFLQRALNVLGANPVLKVDGDIGVRTLLALSSYLNRRVQHGETVLLNMLNAFQGERYVTLAEQYPKNKRFIFGWFSHRVGVL